MYFKFPRYYDYEKIYVKSISINNEKAITFSESKNERFNFFHTIFKKKWSEVKTISVTIATKTSYEEAKENTIQLIKTDDNNNHIEQSIIFNENNELKISVPEVYHLKVEHQKITPEKFYKDIIVKRNKLLNTKKITSIASIYFIQDKRIYDDENQKSSIFDDIIADEIRHLIKIKQELPFVNINKLITYKKGEKENSNILNYINYGLYEKEIISKEKKIYDYENKAFINSFVSNTNEGIMIPYHYYGDYSGTFEFQYKINDKKTIKLNLNFLDNVQQPLLHPNYGKIKMKYQEKDESYYKPIEYFRYFMNNENILKNLVSKTKMQFIELENYLLKE